MPWLSFQEISPRTSSSLHQKPEQSKQTWDFFERCSFLTFVLFDFRPPVIIRTHSQSLTVFGGLKAIWKKATAHVRQVKRNGLLAVVAPVDPRESSLWSGFAPVTPPGADGSERRSGLWWMSGRNAIANGDEALPQQEGTEMEMRPAATRTRSASSNTSAETFVTAESSPS